LTAAFDGAGSPVPMSSGVGNRMIAYIGRIVACAARPAKEGMPPATSRSIIINSRYTGDVDWL